MNCNAALVSKRASPHIRPNRDALTVGTIRLPTPSNVLAHFEIERPFRLQVVRPNIARSS